MANALGESTATIQTGLYSAPSKMPTTTAFAPQRLIGRHSFAEGYSNRAMHQKSAKMKAERSIEDTTARRTKENADDRSKVSCKRKEWSGHRLCRPVTGHECTLA